VTQIARHDCEQGGGRVTLGRPWRVGIGARTLKASPKEISQMPNMCCSRAVHASPTMAR